MNASKSLPILALLVSLALLIPGVTQPLITLQADLNRQAVLAEGKKLLNEQKLHPALMSMATQFLDGLKVEGHSQVYNKTRSILGTADDLWRSGYRLVAVLILTFSVVIPAIKCLLLLGTLMTDRRRPLLRANALLGKWSMADVFAMGVVIALLAANAASSESSMVNFRAELHSGFYWFLAYCMASGLIGQCLAQKESTS